MQDKSSRIVHAADFLPDGGNSHWNLAAGLGQPDLPGQKRFDILQPTRYFFHIN